MRLPMMVPSTTQRLTVAGDTASRSAASSTEAMAGGAAAFNVARSSRMGASSARTTSIRASRTRARTWASSERSLGIVEPQTGASYLDRRPAARQRCRKPRKRLAPYRESLPGSVLAKLEDQFPDPIRDRTRGNHRAVRPFLRSRIAHAAFVIAGLAGGN